MIPQVLLTYRRILFSWQVPQYIVNACKLSISNMVHDIEMQYVLMYIIFFMLYWSFLFVCTGELSSPDVVVEGTTTHCERLYTVKTIVFQDIAIQYLSMCSVFSVLCWIYFVYAEIMTT